MTASSSVFLVFCLFSVYSVNSIRFDSDSSSSCEDDKGRGGGHYNGGGGGNGGGNGNGGTNNGGPIPGNPGCPSRGPAQWTRFNRPSGGWCMLILDFPWESGNYSSAVDSCRTYSASVSGVQNSAEMHWIVDTAANWDRMAGTGSIWIGARRTGACMRQKQTARCTQKTSFEWTDSSTTGTAGFTWLDRSQPDNAHGLDQNCAVMFYAGATTVWKGHSWWPGALDDTTCYTNGMDKTGARVIRGFVCGKPATN